MQNNWTSFAFKSAQTDYEFGQDIIKIGANYSASKAKQAQLEIQAESFKKSAEDFNKKVGRIQEQGRVAREQRMIQAGQDVGRINAGAAGSGIDVSSNTVRKTVQDTMVSAYNDAAIMAQNEADAAHEMQNKELEQRFSKVWTEYNIGVEKVNRKLALVDGILTAASKAMSGAVSSGGYAAGG